MTTHTFNVKMFIILLNQFTTPEGTNDILSLCRRQEYCAAKGHELPVISEVIHTNQWESIAISNVLVMSLLSPSICLCRYRVDIRADILSGGELCTILRANTSQAIATVGHEHVPTWYPKMARTPAVVLSIVGDVMVGIPHEF